MFRSPFLVSGAVDPRRLASAFSRERLATVSTVRSDKLRQGLQSDRVPAHLIALRRHCNPKVNSLRGGRVTYC